MRKIIGLAAALLGLAVGCAGPGAGAAPAAADAAPVPLRLTDMQGTAHDLDAALARGETVALVFWQTWCESCEHEAPALVDAARRHGDAIRFLGVVPGREAVVDDAEVARTAAAWGYPFPQVRDRDLSLTAALEVTGTPTIVVLGRERRVLYRGHRPPPDWGALRGAPPAEAAPAAGDPACVDGVCPLPGEEHP